MQRSGTKIVGKVPICCHHCLEIPKYRRHQCCCLCLHKDKRCTMRDSLPVRLRTDRSDWVSSESYIRGCQCEWSNSIDRCLRHRWWPVFYRNKSRLMGPWCRHSNKLFQYSHTDPQSRTLYIHCRPFRLGKGCYSPCCRLVHSYKRNSLLFHTVQIHIRLRWSWQTQPVYSDPHGRSYWYRSL